jgi:hypothetical protein
LFQEVGAEGREFLDNHSDELSDNWSCPSREMQNSTLGVFKHRQEAICQGYWAEVPILGKRLD